MVRYCAIIFGCLALGELLGNLIPIGLPSSIIGMLLLTFFLKMNWIKLHWVKGFSDLLLAHLGLFFIPPCIKIILYYQQISQNLWSILLSMFVSTLLVFYVTGITYQFIRKKKRDERISE